MDLDFASNRLRKTLSDDRAMQRDYGELAKALKNRLSVLSQAHCLDDVPKVPPERCHQLTQDRDEQFAVDIRNQHRLIFEVANDPIPRKSDGGIDLKQVTSIRIIEIADYH